MTDEHPPVAALDLLLEAAANHRDLAKQLKADRDCKYGGAWAPIHNQFAEQLEALHRDISERLRAAPSDTAALIQKWRDKADDLDKMHLYPQAQLCRQHADELASLRAAPPPPEPWEQRARELLWKNHGCPVTALYGDDGEMQCCSFGRHRPWDFKRTPWDELAHEVFVLMLSESQAAAALPSAPEPPERPLLRRIVEKLKVIIPKVDGSLALQQMRTGMTYDGPNLIEELKEADALLAAPSPPHKEPA